MFTLDYKSRVPLCDQLRESVVKMSACGVLEPGSQLPSVRQLAQELGINPNTVQKAYRILERDGVIQTVPGKGSFLSEGEEAGRLQKQRGREKLSEALQLALDSGMTEGEIRTFCGAYLDELEEGAQ